MRAILMTAVGGPDVLTLAEVAEPHITAADQIKVRLHAAGLNPVDAKIRRNGLLYPLPLPAILGCDGAGEVVTIGDAVDRFEVGDKVWFCHGGLGREPGNYADLTVLPQRWAAHMPASLGFAEAAALPLVLITAWGALFGRGGLQSGQTALIHAGAGGVGHVAIQLAKLRGARVITTVSTEEKARLCRSLGADDIIFHSRRPLAEAVGQLTGGNGADLVLDTVGPAVFEDSVAATAYFGRLVTLLDPGPVDLAQARLRNLCIGFELMLTPMLKELADARDLHLDILNQCRRLIDEGKLRPHLSQTFALAQAAAAHRLLDLGHTTGKMALTL